MALGNPNAPRWSERLVESLLRLRFPVLSLGLGLLVVFHLATGDTAGDFWEHAAAVRELAERPLVPRHPIYDLEGPHVFLTPYTWVLGRISRLTGVSAVAVVRSAGVLNLALLILGLRALAGRLCRGPVASSSFWTLFLVVFLWGRDPWLYSGFFHLQALGYVSPYQSTLASALVCFGLAGVSRSLEEGWTPGRVAGCYVALTVVLLIHPLSFVAFGLAAGALTLAASRLRPRSLTVLTLGGFVAVGCGALWPFYSVLQLGHGSAVFDAANRPMYEGLIVRSLPVALVGLVALANLVRVGRRSLPLVFLALGFAYAGGYVFDRTSFGRVLPFMILTLQLATADGVAALESSSALRRPLARAALCVGLVAVVAGPAARAIVRMAGRGLSNQLQTQRTADDLYAWLPSFVGRDTVVLAEVDAAWPIPAFAGRIVAALHPQAFVPDQGRREVDVRRALDPTTSVLAREEILRRYKVRFLLFGPSTPAARELSMLGRVVYQDGTWILVDLALPHERRVLERLAEAFHGVEDGHSLVVTFAGTTSVTGGAGRGFSCL